MVERQSVPPRRSRIERELDDNEQAQRRGQKEQDGSEIRSVELERLTAEGMTLIERRNVLNSSAIAPPNSSSAKPDHPGARVGDRWSIIAR